MTSGLKRRIWGELFATNITFDVTLTFPGLTVCKFSLPGCVPELRLRAPLQHPRISMFQ